MLRWRSVAVAMIPSTSKFFKVLCNRRKLGETGISEQFPIMRSCEHVVLAFG